MLKTNQGGQILHVVSWFVDLLYDWMLQMFYQINDQLNNIYVAAKVIEFYNMVQMFKYNSQKMHHEEEKTGPVKIWNTVWLIIATSFVCLN